MVWPLPSTPWWGTGITELIIILCLYWMCQDTTVIQMQFVQGTTSTQPSQFGKSLIDLEKGLNLPLTLNCSIRSWTRIAGTKTLTMNISWVSFYVLFLSIQIESQALQGRKKERASHDGVMRIFRLQLAQNILATHFIQTSMPAGTSRE